jgi:hypothetical protein
LNKERLSSTAGTLTSDTDMHFRSASQAPTKAYLTATGGVRGVMFTRGVRGVIFGGGEGRDEGGIR